MDKDREDELLNDPHTNGQAADFKRHVEEIADKDMHGSIGQPEEGNQYKGHFDLADPKGDVTVVTSADGTVTTLTEQPKPKFTLQDLDAKLSLIYDQLKPITSVDQNTMNLNLVRGVLQELLAICNKHINDLESIDVQTDSTQAITTALETEKVAFHVTGVQLIENGQNVGTSLYSTVFKARKIRDILNSKFAELRVNHEAKLINYPVY